MCSMITLIALIRSCMTQERLNHVAVCNVHKEYIDKLHLMAIPNEYIALNERRMQLFGKF